MKKKLLISAFITTLSLLNSLPSASESVLDEMKRYAKPNGLSNCTQEDINTFEATLNIGSIPLQLQQYWLSLGHLSFPYHQIIRPHLNRNDSIETILTARQNGVPEEWFSFCSEELNNYCINLKTGEVKFWDFHTLDFSTNPNDQWKSFFDWIAEDWLTLIKDKNSS